MQLILNHLPNSEKQIFIECALIHICILLPYHVTAFKFSTMHAYCRLPLYKHNSIVSPYMAVNTFRTCQRLGKWQDILEASLQAYHFLMMNVIFLYDSSFHSIFSLRGLESISLCTLWSLKSLRLLFDNPHFISYRMCLIYNIWFCCPTLLFNDVTQDFRVFNNT